MCKTLKTHNAKKKKADEDPPLRLVTTRAHHLNRILRKTNEDACERPEKRSRGCSLLLPAGDSRPPPTPGGRPLPCADGPSAAHDGRPLVSRERGTVPRGDDAGMPRSAAPAGDGGDAPRPRAPPPSVLREVASRLDTGGRRAPPPAGREAPAAREGSLAALDGRPPRHRGREAADDSGRPPTRNEGRTPRRLFFREAARRPRRESPNAPPYLPGAGSPHVEGGRPNLAVSEPTLRGAGRLFPPVVWIPRRPSYLCQEATCRPRREATGSLWTEAASSPAS